MDCGARVRIPVRCAEADECRDHVDPMVVADPRGEAFRFCRAAEHPQAVAKPFDRCPGHEDRAFQGVGRAAMQPVRGRGEQAVGRLHGCLARVEQEEAARPIGRFDHARVEAGLSDERCLLVARHSADGTFAGRRVRRRSPRKTRYCLAPPGGALRECGRAGKGPRPIARRECRKATSGRHWWHRWREQRRPSASRGGSCRSCRTPGRPVRPWCAHSRHCRGSRPASWRRNRDRAAGRSSPGPPLPSLRP